MDPRIQAALELGKGLAPALVVAGVAITLAWRPWGRSSRGQGSSTAWAAPIAIGLGYAAGYLGLEGWPGLELVGSFSAQVFFVALVLTLFGVFQAAAQRQLRGVRALLCIGAALYLSWSLIDRGRLESSEAALRVGWMAAAVFLVWESEEWLARRRAGAERPVTWVLVCALTSAALFQGGSVSQTNLGAVLAGCVALCALVGWRVPAFSLARGGVGCLVTIQGSLLLAGHTVSYLPGNSALLLLAAPLASWLAEVPGLARLGRMGRPVLAVFAPLAVAGAGLWLAIP